MSKFYLVAILALVSFTAEARTTGVQITDAAGTLYDASNPFPVTQGSPGATPWPVLVTTRPVTQFMVPSVLDTASINIPESSGALLTIAVLTSAIKQISIHDETGQFIDFYEGATLKKIIPPGFEGKVDVTLAAGSTISLRAHYNVAIIAGKLLIEFHQ